MVEVAWWVRTDHESPAWESLVEPRTPALENQRGIEGTHVADSLTRLYMGLLLSFLPFTTVQHRIINPVLFRYYLTLPYSELLPTVPHPTQPHDNNDQIR